MKAAKIISCHTHFWPKQSEAYLVEDIVLYK